MFYKGHSAPSSGSQSCLNQCAAAHLAEVHGTPVCRSTPVENHWHNMITSWETRRFPGDTDGRVTSTVPLLHRASPSIRALLPGLCPRPSTSVRASPSTQFSGASRLRFGRWRMCFSCHKTHIGIGLLFLFARWPTHFCPSPTPVWEIRSSNLPISFLGIVGVSVHAKFGWAI